MGLFWVGWLWVVLRRRWFSWLCLRCCGFAYGGGLGVVGLWVPGVLLKTVLGCGRFMWWVILVSEVWWFVDLRWF